MFGQGFNEFFQVNDGQPDADGLITLPLIPLRDLVIFPNMVTPLLVGWGRSLAAVNAAQSQNKTLIAVAQLDPTINDPQPDELYLIGTEIAPGRLMRLPDGSNTMLVQGRRRLQIVRFVGSDPYFKVKVRPLSEPTPRKTRETQALMRASLRMFEKSVQMDADLPEEAYVFAMNTEEPGALADVIASTLDLPVEDRQSLLELIDPIQRLRQVSVLLRTRNEMLELEEQINNQVQQEVDRGQREMYLREQMRAIQSELGESDIFQQEINELRERIETIGMPPEVFERAVKELNRLLLMPPMAPEVGIIRTYLDWLIELPWTKATEDKLDIEAAAKVLDEEHFGLPKAKDRILEHIAVRKLAPNKMKSPILCFVGPPGTGKTSLGRSIAKALGRQFVRVSLGGVRDEAEIRGHRRTYIGALPGRIIQTMRRAGSVNPVFMLDEIDKLGHDFRGDPSSALLEVLDPEQNNSFSDHYLEVSYDLSKVMFVTTANILDTVPPALLDRLEIIEFSGYTEEEKLSIAHRFLIPRQFDQHGLAERDIHFEEKALQTIIREYTWESGVRNFEREIAKVCRKLARRIASDKSFAKRVTSEQLARYLGPAQFLQNKLESGDHVGLATGLAWTENGGETMPVEVTLMPGKGSVTLTGQLGDVMQESAQAALSYTRSQAATYGISEDMFEKTDIHLHVPEGAVPKDGPSAGVTLATALMSAFTERKVYGSLAMTGEITLRGRVLPVGGIKEKVLAAHRAGLKRVIIPSRNRKDLIDLRKQVLDELEVIYVEGMSDVLKTALAPAEKVAKPKKVRATKAKTTTKKAGKTSTTRRKPPAPEPTPNRPSAGQ